MDYDLSTAVKTVAGFGMALGVSGLATDVEAAVVQMSASFQGTSNGSSFFLLTGGGFSGTVTAYVGSGFKDVGGNFGAYGVGIHGITLLNPGDTVSANMVFEALPIVIASSASVATFGFVLDTDNLGWFQISFGPTVSILNAAVETVAGQSIVTAVVPLPASATMLGGALALAGGAAALRRRRKVKAEAIAA